MPHYSRSFQLMSSRLQQRQFFFFFNLHVAPPPGVFLFPAALPRLRDGVLLYELGGLPSSGGGGGTPSLRVQMQLKICLILVAGQKRHADCEPKKEGGKAKAYHDPVLSVQDPTNTANGNESMLELASGSLSLDLASDWAAARCYRKGHRSNDCFCIVRTESVSGKSTVKAVNELRLVGAV